MVIPRVSAIVVFLFLGMVVNVSIAWGLPRFARSPQVTRELSGDEVAAFWSRRPAGFSTSRPVSEGKQMSRLGVSVRLFRSSDDATLHLGAPGQVPGVRRVMSCCGVELQYGVPFRSVYWDAWQSPTLFVRKYDVGIAGRYLPWHPIWPGFIANTLLYAAVLWLMICGLTAVRRIVRRQSGLCPACAYDLRHADHEACPECGAVWAKDEGRRSPARVFLPITDHFPYRHSSRYSS